MIEVALYPHYFTPGMPAGFGSRPPPPSSFSFHALLSRHVTPSTLVISRLECGLGANPPHKRLISRPSFASFHAPYGGTSLIKNSFLLGPYSRPMLRALW